MCDVLHVTVALDSPLRHIEKLSPRIQVFPIHKIQLKDIMEELLKYRTITDHHHPPPPTHHHLPPHQSPRPPPIINVIYNTTYLHEAHDHVDVKQRKLGADVRERVRHGGPPLQAAREVFRLGAVVE